MHAGRRAQSVRRPLAGVFACLFVLAGASAAPAQVKQEQRGQGPVSPLEAAREESAVRDRPPSRHELPAGELRLSAAELVSAYSQALEITVGLDRDVSSGTLELTLPRLWTSRSKVSGLPYARIPGKGRGAERAGRSVTFTFSDARAGDTASFRLEDNGIPAGTYELGYQWRDDRGRSARGTAAVVVYSPAREGQPERTWSRLPTFGMEVNATSDGLAEAETYVTVVPGNKKRFIVGANTNVNGGGYNAWITDDGGETFVKRSVPTAMDAPGEASPEASIPCCDPMSAADAAGNIWYGGLSFSNGASNPSRIFVNRIAAGTNTFQPQTTGLAARTSATQDKPMMSIDNSPTSPTFGRLYVVWNEPQSPGIKIVLSRCDTRVSGVLDAARCDNADNWSAPVSVTPATGNYIYADVGTGPDGKVYVVWWDYSAANAIRGDVCDPATTDCATGGWGTNVKTIASLDATGGAPIPFACPIVAQPGGRASTAPGVDVDVSNGPNRGRVYVTWGDLRTGSGTTRCAGGTAPQTTHLSFDAFVASAAGALPGSAAPSPSVATRLVTDGDGGGAASADDWFPWLAVDQTTGQAWADFYSTREDATRKTAHFYARSVTPSGGSHALGTLRRVSNVASDYSTAACCGFGNDYGDYTGIDATQGVAIPVWSDKRETDGEAFVFVEGDANLVAGATTIDDGVDGDSDGALEPGEGFDLIQRLRNVGGSPTSSVSAVLSDNNVTVSQPASGYENIAPQEERPNLTPFEARVPAAHQCGAPLNISLDVTTLDGPFTVPVSIPTGEVGAAQTSTASPGVAIPDGNANGVSSDIALSGAGRVADLDVRVNITHTWISDVSISLTSPQGTTIDLSSRNGSSGDNYTNTVFDDEAATAITSGTAPFTGSFRPEQALSAFDGQPATGTWRLTVTDVVTVDSGTLSSWATVMKRRTCSPTRPQGVEKTRSSHSAPAPIHADFNGDGRSDLAVGVPGEDLGAARNAGAVQVFYGTASGLSAVGAQTLSQDSSGVADSAQSGDEFGAALTVGDVNADGRADLAVGSPGEDWGSSDDAGTVHLLLGSGSGLTGTGSQQWTQDSDGVAGAVEPGDRFGGVLSLGNVGGSSNADLAIGVPEEDKDALADAGLVHVLYGTDSGLTATGSQLIDQNLGGVADSVEAGDHFGSALAMADLGGASGFRDLAIGVPGEDVGAVAAAGAVHALYGAAGALSAAGSHFFTANTAGAGDTAGTGDRFGSTLAAANFGRGALADLAIGVPEETLGGAEGAGAVRVLYSKEDGTGLSSASSQWWTQDTAGITDVAEDGDRFGSALAVGRPGGTVTEADLAIGAAGESMTGAAGAGAVHVIYGAPANGLREVGSQFFTQNSANVEETAEAGDAFGAALAIVELGRAASGDLVVGAPGESVGSVVRAGAMNVLYSTGSTLSATDDQLWSQNRTGVPDTSERNDGFGAGAGR